MFPEIEESVLKKKPFMKKKGGYFDVIERVLPKDELKDYREE